MEGKGKSWGHLFSIGDLLSEKHENDNISIM